MTFEALPLESVPGGLFSAAYVERSNAHHPSWSGASFAWDSNACPVTLDLSDMCIGGDFGPIASASNPNKEGWPFGISAESTCGSVGYTQEERRTMVREQLKAGTEKAVERELQKGEAAIVGSHFDSHYLADFDATTLGGATALSITLGIATMEQALADCGIGTQGVIHMTRSAAIVAAGADLVKEKGNKLFTKIGTPVVAGTGYDQAATIPAAKPTTAAKPVVVSPASLTSEQLIYATGPIAVRLGPIEILDDIFDKIKNEFTMVATRPAAVYMDSCCHFAAKVKL